VIVAVPADIAVTIPVVFTVAIEPALEVQIAVSVTSLVDEG
jgi:hypothetical protein